MPMKYNPYSGELDWVMGPGSGTATTEFDTDSGSATPTAAGVITMAGGTGLNTAGASNTVTINLDDPVVVDNGGTGRTTHTEYAVICGGTTTTAAQQSIASVGSSGQILTSNGAAALPTFQDAPGGGLTWNEETGTSATMAVNNGYIANNASLVTLTLPTTAAVGDIVAAVGKGAGLFSIAQNASEIIHFIDTDTTTGASGSVTALEQYACIELICIVADTEWAVRASTGNFEVV